MPNYPRRTIALGPPYDDGTIPPVLITHSEARCAHGEERAETVAGYHSDWVCVKCGRRRSACGHDDKARVALAPAGLATTPSVDEGEGS